MARYYWVDAYVTPIYEHGKISGYQSVRCKPGPSSSRLPPRPIGPAFRP